jgi:bifunctional non-homologous end joining protein LigD
MKHKIFVVQKHDASHLHYDFRLEIEGVLKSWAIPKGVPDKKGEKRLAVLVEDHPLEYADFEGVIPEGNYGAGTVKIWDKGIYEIISGSFDEGKIEFHLNGKRFDGDYVLIKTKMNDEKKNWLLMKKD